MDSNNNSASIKKLSVFGVMFVIFPVVFGFNNSAVAFYKMGYASIIWYIIGAVSFFLPLMFVVAEYAFSFKDSEGGLQTWMNNAKGNFFGFVTTFIFYFAQIFWMVNFSTTRLWIPLSYGLLGIDSTQSFSFLGLNSTATIGLMSITFIVLVTFFATRGFNKLAVIAKLGGAACMSINVILFSSAIIIAALKIFKGIPLFEEPIQGTKTFLIPPNEASANMVSILGFMSFATFAYAGAESLGSLASKTKTEKTFSKGIIYSSIVIMIGYSSAIFLWGFVQNSQNMNANSAINFGNVLYNSMANLGAGLGNIIGLDPTTSSNVMAPLFARATGIALFLTTIGAFFVIIYAPLQALLNGAPKGLFPEFLTRKNKVDINQNAMWVQAVVVCSIIAIISFGGSSAKEFYSLLISMANVTQTCPYIFIFLSFPAFRNNLSLNHNYTILKSKFSVYAAAIIGFSVVLIADILTVLDPILNEAENAVTKTTFMGVGPLLCISIAILIYKSYEKRTKTQQQF